MDVRTDRETCQFKYYFRLLCKYIEVFIQETCTASTETDSNKKEDATSTTKDEKTKSSQKAKDKESSDDQSYVKHKFDLNEKWSQTIDFPRKKKGTQSDPILTYDSHAQVTSKDLLL